MAIVRDDVWTDETVEVRVVSVVDLHAHVFPRSALAARQRGADWHGRRVERADDGRLVLVGERSQIRMDSSAFYQEPVESRIDVMDRWGIDVQLLSVSPVLFGYRDDVIVAVARSEDVNEDIADIVRTWPRRFAGLGTLPLQDPGAAVRELERCVNQLGLAGACVGTHVAGANWDEPALRGVLEAAESLGALLFVHPADVRIQDAVPRHHLRNTIGNPLETTVAVGSIIFGGVLDRFPALKLCFAHGGGFACWGTERFDHAHRVRSDARVAIERPPSDYLRLLYFDSLTHSIRNLRMLLDAVGSSHVVLGTDFPADMGQVDPVHWLTAEQAFDEATTDAILGGNAERLLALRP